MAIRFGLAMNAAIFVVVGAVVVSLNGSSTALLGAGTVPPSGPAVCVYQYSPPSGDAYFALGVRAERATLPLGEVKTHAILVDTSASQSGAYRQRSMEVVRGYLASLGDDHRVRLFAVDVKAEPMMPDFASAKSAECASGVEAVANRVPLGATNQLGCLRGVLDALPADAPASIVYIGDGMSAARLAPPAEVAELAAEMRGHQVALHGFAVGPQTDLELLGTFAQYTGGILLLDKGTQATRGTAAGSELAAAAKTPVLYPTKVVAEGQTVGMWPRMALPLRSDRASVYVGKGRVSAALTLTFEFAGNQPPAIFRAEGASRHDSNGVLALLWERAKSSGGVSAALAGTNLIAEANDRFTERLDSMLSHGEQAVASHDASTGEQMARAVAELDRGNPRAASLMASAARLRKETAAHEILRQVDSEPAPEGKQPPAGPPIPSPPPTKPLGERSGPRQSDSISEYHQLMAVRGQQLTT
jgi:hypothetical protein